MVLPLPVRLREHFLFIAEKVILTSMFYSYFALWIIKGNSGNLVVYFQTSNFFFFDLRRYKLDKLWRCGASTLIWTENWWLQINCFANWTIGAFGGGEWTWTTDLQVMSLARYQLLYPAWSKWPESNWHLYLGKVKYWPLYDTCVFCSLLSEPCVSAQVL